MKRKRTTKMVGLALSALFVAAMLLPSVARADLFTSTLGTGNSDISGFTEPYGTVTVNFIDSTHATVTFDAGSVGTNNFYFIDTSAAAVEVNATSWTLSNLGGVAATFGTGVDLSDNGSKNVDGFGTFNQTIKEFDGYAWALTQISFDLTNTSGTWADAASVLAFNAGAFDAAAHIAVCDTTTNPSCGTTIGAAATGFAGEGTGVPKENPEPASLLLLGAGLVGLAQMIRRKTKS